LFRHACIMDLEGIVAKRGDSRYVSGRFDRPAQDQVPRLRAVATELRLKAPQRSSASCMAAVWVR
jgi:hypothetical protein